jgi:hypothetical protein
MESFKGKIVLICIHKIFKNIKLVKVAVIVEDILVLVVFLCID